MKNATLVFDVGGTFIKFGVVDQDGILIFKDKVLTPKVNCRVSIIDCIIDNSWWMISKFSLENCIQGVGVSTAGLVDISTGEVISMNENLPDYSGAQIGDEVLKKLGLKCRVDNDVNCAALGESWCGIGKGEKDFVFLALGTGIGMGIFINGKPYRGKNGFAGEIGHITINEGGILCPCGMEGCYERYASTIALVNRYNEEAGRVTQGISGEELFRLIENNDQLACKVFDNYIDHLVTGLINVTYTLDPGTIILGGGISAQGDVLISRIRQVFEKRCQADFARNTKIVASVLGNDASLLGAGKMVMHD